MKRLIPMVIFTLAMLPCNADSPFGVVCPWAGTRDAGIKWIRCGAGCTALDWAAIEKERGVIDWKAADAEVSGIIAEGASPVPILGYSPKWASTGPDGSYPPNLNDWSDFVYRIVSRYKGKVKYWEVWNEPDIGFWKGTVQQYSDLLKSACVAAKKADPQCKIVFGGTAGVNVPFIEQVYQYGGKYYFDVMAVHPYQWGDTFDAQAFISQLTDLHDLMVKWDDGHKEIWLTEMGWSTGDKGISEEVQARLLAQALITSQSIPELNVTKVFCFCIKDWGGPGYGLLRPDGSRKPAFQAYKAVTSALEGAELVLPMIHERGASVVFCKGGKCFMIAWTPGKEPQRIPEIDAPSVEWKNMLTGKTGKRLTEIGGEPLIMPWNGYTPKPTWKKPIAPPMPYKLDPWASVQPPEGTSLPYAIRGRDNEIPIVIHNESSDEVTVKAQIGGFTAVSRAVSGRVTLKLALPQTMECGEQNLRITATCADKQLAPIAVPIQIADGPVTQFRPNSTIESKYLVDNQGSGTSPSVRFNGTWTYKLDLSNAVGGTLSLCVGAYRANEWSVLLSSDQKNWKLALAGKSERSCQQTEVTEYAGGPLFIKFEGNDQQLSNLILTRK